MSKEIVNKIPYLGVILSYFFGIILPSLQERVYTMEDGEIVLVSKKNIFQFSYNFLMGVGFVSIFILLLAIISIIVSMVKASKEQMNRRFTLISLILGFFSIVVIDFYRQKSIIDSALIAHTSFRNVAPFSFGVYFIWIGIFFNIMTLKWPGYESKEALVEHVTFYTKSKASSLFGPTTVQYLTIHVITLFFMFITFGIWKGFSKILQGPAYYQQMILTHGLNSGIKVPFILDVFAIFTAPLVVILMGMVLFSLKTSGFAPNGPGIQATAPEHRYYEVFSDFETWAYFSKDVPFGDIYFGSYKFNLFYILIVFLPLILGVIIGSIINHMKMNSKTVVFKHYFYVLLLAGFIISVIMSSFTAPVYISPWGFFESLFIDRRNNTFIRYKWYYYDSVDNGGYHPLSIFDYLIIVWLPILAIITIIDKLIITSLTGEMRKKSESLQVQGKYYDNDDMDLPFAKE